MHVFLRELATPGLSKSLTYYSNYVKSKFIASYSIDCNIINCYACDHSN